MEVWEARRKGRTLCTIDGVAELLINTDAALGSYVQGKSLLTRVRNMYLPGVVSNASPSGYSPSIEGSVLRTKAVVLDELKIVYPAFPDELELRWEACTEFMVAVGNCEYSALHQDKQEPNPYLTVLGKEISFWAAIFGCDLYGQDAGFRSMIEENNGKWLPAVPETWQFKEPRVTVLSSGLLSLAVLAAAAGDSLVTLGQGMQTNLIPQDWDEHKIDFFQRRFNALGRTWGTQPYDLRARPFGLPNVVPDPYLESRPTEYYTPSKLGAAVKAEFEDSSWTDRKIPFPREWLCKPEDGLRGGSHIAAQERSFFITSQGYMGLAPPDSQSGDHVILLQGVRFPFILRKAGKGNHTYQLLGEAFIDTVVDAELIEDRCRQFQVETISIV